MTWRATSRPYGEQGSKLVAAWVPLTHQAQWVGMPVWLFSSGPLGADDPQPDGEPAQLDKGELGFGERLIARAVGAPDGDFRDWAAIICLG